jgi:hypothetical protein
VNRTHFDDTMDEAKAGRGRAERNGRAAPAFAPSVLCSELKAADPDREWLWRGLIEAEGVTLFSALWKAGKTTLLAHLLKWFGQGGAFLGRAVLPAKVICVTEEGQARWAKRRDAIGLGDWIRFRVQPFAYKPDWDTWFAFLADLAKEVACEKAGLVVFDTLDKLWPVVKENDAGEVTAALMPLRKLGAASLLSHHLTKADGKEAKGSRGSGALTAFVDTIVEMRRFNPDDQLCRRRVLKGWGRDEEVPPELVVELSADGKSYTTHGDRGQAQAELLRLVILGLLEASPEGLTQEQVREAWPSDPAPRSKTLRDALNAGVKSGRWGRSGKGSKGSPYVYSRNPLGWTCSRPDMHSEEGRGGGRDANPNDATPGGESDLGDGDGFASRPHAQGGEGGTRKTSAGANDPEPTAQRGDAWEPPGPAEGCDSSINGASEWGEV